MFVKQTFTRHFLSESNRELVNNDGKGNREIALMRRTIAVHVWYKFLYISLLSSAKKRGKIIELCVFWRTRTTTANLELNADDRLYGVPV